MHLSEIILNFTLKSPNLASNFDELVKFSTMTKSENPNLIEQLKEIGFSEYKAKVFVTLAKGKIMSASEIVNEAKIVRGSIYDILKLVVKLGYCNEIETNRILQYQIIDPDIILDKIVNQHQKEVTESINRIKNTFTSVKQIYSSTNESEDKQINIEIIRGFNKHRISKYKELLLSAKKEICGLYKFKGLVSSEADSLAKNFIKRGGKIRTIYKTGLDFKISRNGNVYEATHEQLIEICREFESTGEQIKLITQDIPNLTIIDGESVFINTEDLRKTGSSQADIILRKSSFAKYMMDLFDLYWSQALTINEYKKTIS